MSNNNEKAKQSSIYLDDEIKRIVKIEVINNPEKWKNMSDWIREAIREKLIKEGKLAENRPTK